jgi:nucleotide-binding universal stress UspA family protein
MSINASQFRSILVPLDGSPLAERALAVAARIAQAGNGSLALALVHEPPPIPFDEPNPALVASGEAAVARAEETYLTGIETRLRGDGTPVSSVTILTGEIGPCLADQARSLGVDLVVMPTHGRGGVQRLWLGSVADYLVRHLDVPVLVLRAGEVADRVNATSAATQLLVPLDGSPLAEEALAPAAELARLSDLELSLLQVVRPVAFVTEPGLTLPTAYDRELTDSVVDQARDYVRDLVEDLRARGFRATGSAVIGWNPVDTILEIARPEQVAMVALATHGRGGMARLALGSVADELIRAARVPVLVMRPTLIGRAGAESPAVATGAAEPLPLRSR